MALEHPKRSERSSPHHFETDLAWAWFECDLSFELSKKGPPPPGLLCNRLLCRVGIGFNELLAATQALSVHGLPPYPRGRILRRTLWRAGVWRRGRGTPSSSAGGIGLPNGYGSKLNHQDMDRRFRSMLPHTRVPFEVPIIDPQPNPEAQSTT